jgi:hypothetical protein
MRRLIIVFLFLSINQLSLANDNEYNVADLFFIDQMNSHNDDFALYFKPRDKAIYMIIKQKTHFL